MKKVLCLAVLLTSALWANEAADRAAIEATVSALNSLPALARQATRISLPPVSPTPLNWKTSKEVRPGTRVS